MTTIMLTEDEVALLVLAESILQHAGYDTLSASSLAEAEAILASDRTIDLVFTDITLMDEAEGGIKVGQLAAQSRPEVPVLYTSGRPVTDGMQALFVTKASFLPKPYTDVELIGAIEGLLKHNAGA